MDDVLASTEMVGIKPNGERLAIAVRIGRPYVSGTDPETWSCPVSVEPLYPKLADIAGLDSLQALVLACNLAFSLLQGFKDKGGRLLHDDGTEFPLEAYDFAKSPSGRADA
jgi:Domain of unknown function (DUF6968)